MFNKMKYDRVQMCLGVVRQETEAAATHMAEGGA